MRPVHSIRVVLCVPLSVLAMMVGRQKGQLPCKRAIERIPRGSVPEWMEEEDPADPGSPGKRPLNGSSSSNGPVLPWLLQVNHGDSWSRFIAGRQGALQCIQY